MLPFHLLPDPVALAVKLLNPLIRREPWAAQRLRAHTGKTVRFDIGLRPFALQILPEGELSSAHDVSAPDVTLSIPSNRWRDVPAALRQRDPAALAGLMHVQGDAALAQVVSDLTRDLRWDVEDDLSRFVGDVAAARVASTVRSVSVAAVETAKRFMGNTAEYLSDESGMLVTRSDFAHWQENVSLLQTRLAALEQRAGRLPRAAVSRHMQGPAGSAHKS